MDEERASYPYQAYTITTLRDEGVWWAKVRISEKDAGGDRPVRGGPWGSQGDARAAAEACCDGKRSG